MKLNYLLRFILQHLNDYKFSKKMCEIIIKKSLEYNIKVPINFNELS